MALFLRVRAEIVAALRDPTTPRTIQRDIDGLRDRGLVTAEGHGRGCGATEAARPAHACAPDAELGLGVRDLDRERLIRFEAHERRRGRGAMRRAGRGRRARGRARAPTCPKTRRASPTPAPQPARAMPWTRQRALPPPDGEAPQRQAAQAVSPNGSPQPRSAPRIRPRPAGCASLVTKRLRDRFLPGRTHSPSRPGRGQGFTGLTR